MEKSDLIAHVSDRTGISKHHTALVLDSTLQVIVEALMREEPVRFIGFGVFELRHCAGRKGRDMKTKESIDIPPKKTPVFRVSKVLKKRFQ